jgi:heterodisulfide reductase subunit B
VNAKRNFQKNDMDLIVVEDKLCQMQYENGRNVVTIEKSFAHNNHEGVNGPTLYNFPFV